LRHLGIPYANFVTGGGDGMDVELVARFAEYLGVKYEFVQTDWAGAIGDLTGKKVKPKGNDVEVLEEVPIRGDVIASGMTVLPWRQKAVAFSSPTFPTQVWVIARADSPLQPIRPTGKVGSDIRAVKRLFRQRTVLCKKNTCLDPDLYDMDRTEAVVKLFNGALNELAPALINGESELLLLDMPDAIIALQKWPGRIKILGPMTDIQDMAAAFRKDSPRLREKFNEFMAVCRKDGSYDRLVKKYYPAVAAYYAGFPKWKERTARLKR
ncbi:MAG TPA: transporter substrate-binding domain-containing protein, partial [Candidatus Aquicultoraceae bacterium]|nr:transporter substrate-binding domain-containing protein [Candidatus Aquicultoraceae bacterium]